MEVTTGKLSDSAFICSEAPVSATYRVKVISGNSSPCIQFNYFREVKLLQLPDFPNFFDMFGLFQSFFMIVAFIFVLFFIVVVVVIMKVCRQGASSMSGGFVIEPPTFVIPDRHQGQTRSDGTEMKTVRLPDRCPSCNASLSPEGIDWVGPLEARCNYCGATVKARFESV